MTEDPGASRLPFGQGRNEFLRQQLADLLARHQSGQVPVVEIVENMLVVLLAALDDGAAVT